LKEKDEDNVPVYPMKTMKLPREGSTSTIMSERRNLPALSFKQTTEDNKIADFNFAKFRKEDKTVTSKENLLNYSNHEQSLMARNLDDMVRDILSPKESDKKLLESLSALDWKVELLQHSPQQLTEITEQKSKLEDCATRLSGLKEVTKHILSVLNKKPDDFPVFVFDPSIHGPNKALMGSGSKSPNEKRKYLKYKALSLDTMQTVSFCNPK
jgi:molecular chaperone DnaK (HSP70)